MINKNKIIFSSFIMLSGLSLFGFSIFSVIFLSSITDLLSTKLGICGINGITIKIGKPDYLIFVYLFYIIGLVLFLSWVVKLYSLLLEYFFKPITYYIPN